MHLHKILKKARSHHMRWINFKVKYLNAINEVVYKCQIRHSAVAHSVDKCKYNMRRWQPCWQQVTTLLSPMTPPSCHLQAMTCLVYSCCYCLTLYVLTLVTVIDAAYKKWKWNYKFQFHLNTDLNFTLIICSSSCSFFLFDGQLAVYLNLLDVHWKMGALCHYSLIYRTNLLHKNSNFIQICYCNLDKHGCQIYNVSFKCGHRDI